MAYQYAEYTKKHYCRDCQWNEPRFSEDEYTCCPECGSDDMSRVVGRFIIDVTRERFLFASRTREETKYFIPKENHRMNKRRKELDGS